jgi:hypothetical protein
MYYVYCFILIFTGAGLGIYGLKRFGISLALAFAIPSLAFLGMLDWISATSFAIVAVIAVLIFFFTTPLTYFNAWFFGTILIALPFAIVYDSMVGENIERLIDMTVKISMAVSIVAVFILRRHLKAIIIGISSGYSFGLGLAGIISYELFSSGKILDAVALPGVLVFAGILGGILFQYFYIAKKNPELIDPTL